MNDFYKKKLWWRFIYAIWPPFLRLCEWMGFHVGRQLFYVGKLKGKCTRNSLSDYLLKNEFEPAILSWRDEGEIMSMRKVDFRIFQYHIRLFEDGEIRAHYEYSSEANPIGHFLEWRFDPKKEEIRELLRNYLA